jgi:hypothetical protein
VVERIGRCVRACSLDVRIGAIHVEPFSSVSQKAPRMKSALHRGNGADMNRECN